MTQRDRLRTARKVAGLTQTQLAETIGVPQSTIGRLEIEQHEPSLRVALAIARRLETSVEHLFGNDPDPRQQRRPGGAGTPRGMTTSEEPDAAAAA